VQQEQKAWSRAEVLRAGSETHAQCGVNAMQQPLSAPSAAMLRAPPRARALLGPAAEPAPGAAAVRSRDEPSARPPATATWHATVVSKRPSPQ